MARDIPLDNLSYSLLVSFSTGSSGSGYLLNNTDSRVFFISAKHVLFDNANNLRGKTATILGYSNNLDENDSALFSVDFEVLLKNDKVHTHNIEDVVVVEWAQRALDGALTLFEGVTLIRAFKGRGVGVGRASTKLFKDVLIGNDVYIMGYPSSIGLAQSPQFNYEKPLVRKGIVAGRNETKNTIILDCEVYPGNSGGPVIEKEQLPEGIAYKLIGTISQFIPFAQGISMNGREIAELALYNNSGYSVIVPCDPMFTIIDSL